MFRRTMIGAVGAVLGLGLGASAALAQDVTLRLHQFLPAQANVPAKILDPWADKIEAESEGRIKIERYPAMQLGGTPPQLMDQVIDGVADIVWTLPGYTPGRFPRTEVFELPFTSLDSGATSRAYWTLGEETMFDQDFKDIKVLGLWVHGPGLIHSKEPIVSVSDLNGVKLRAPTRVTNGMFERLGATPIGMPVPAVPEGLSKGVIDATVIPWEVTGALKVPELVTNHLEFGLPALYVATFVLAMNKDRYEALPDDLKKVIDDNSGLEFSGNAGAQMQADDAPERAKALEMGNTVTTLTEEQVAEWREAAAPTSEAWVEEMDGSGMDGTGLRARALELIEQFAEN